MSIMIATRGPRIGQCNICGDIGPLTDDHTPPKGCFRPKQVELQSVLRRLSTAPTKDQKTRISQSGVKYRTLCHRCNNAMLGATYDPPFISFVNQIAGVLRSPIALPEVLPIGGQPQAILRSALGHMAAQGVGRYKKGPLTEAFRDYFLDTSLPLPSPLWVYYWAYPYRTHLMVRDAAYLDMRFSQPFALWFLKFYPVAFMVAWDEPGTLPFPVQALHTWRNLPYEAEVELPLRLQPLPPEVWPELPMETSVLLYGQEAINVTTTTAADRARIEKLGRIWTEQ